MRINEVLSEGFWSSFAQSAGSMGGLRAGTSFPMWSELEQDIEASGIKADTIRNKMKPQANVAAEQMTATYMAGGATIMKGAEGEPPRSWENLTAQEKTDLLAKVLDDSTKIMFKKSLGDLLAGATTPDQKQAVNTLNGLGEKLKQIDISLPNANQAIKANFVAQCLELFIIAMGQISNTSGTGSGTNKVAGTTSKSLGLELVNNADGSVQITYQGRPIDLKNTNDKAALAKLFKL